MTTAIPSTIIGKFKGGISRMLQNLDDGHYLWELWFTIMPLYKFSRIEKSKIVCHCLKNIMKIIHREISNR